MVVEIYFPGTKLTQVVHKLAYRGPPIYTGNACLTTSGVCAQDSSAVSWLVVLSSLNRSVPIVYTGAGEYPGTLFMLVGSANNWLRRVSRVRRVSSNVLVYIRPIGIANIPYKFVFGATRNEMRSPREKTLAKRPVWMAPRMIWLTTPVVRRKVVRERPRIVTNVAVINTSMATWRTSQEVTRWLIETMLGI